MNKSIIVYGPQGCGKTRHAARVAKHFGLNNIADEGKGDWIAGKTGISTTAIFICA